MAVILYDLINNGSVFLVTLNKQDSGNSQVTQLSLEDVSSLVIDYKTLSVASVTAFFYANQEILDFFDTSLSNYNNNSNNA